MCSCLYFAVADIANSVLQELRAFQASQEEAETSTSRIDNGMLYITTRPTLPSSSSDSPPAVSSTSVKMAVFGSSSGTSALGHSPDSAKPRTASFCPSIDQDLSGVEDNATLVDYAMEHERSCAVENDTAVQTDSPSIPLSWSLPLSPPDNVTLSKELLMSEMREYVAYHYQRYPLWHPTMFIEQVDGGEHDASIDFRLSCYSMIIINEAARFRQTPQRGTGRLLELLQQIQSQRTSYLAQNPSCEAVTQSFAMFVAYSVCDEHKLAFYYLNEACGLLRLIDPTTLMPVARALYWRISAVLFVTELASLAVYGNPRVKGTMAYCKELAENKDLMDWHINEEAIPDPWFLHLPLQRRFQALDNKAVRMLHALVLLYGAERTDQILEVSVPRTNILAIIESAVPKPDTSMQEADVNLTQQWLLSQHWEKKCAASSAAQRQQKVKPRHDAQAAWLLQSIGLSSLQHIRAVDPGQQRIIGHGKLAKLSTSIFNIASTLDVLAQCKDIISELIRVVYDLDYETLFTPELAVIQIVISGVPQQFSLPFNEVSELHHEGVGSTWEDSEEQGTSAE
ncbi:hypothetical protein J7337_009131 [Fusarium musae]|uniref:Transcription factor domain-containing protein n=1 Tax=Fusarium musae TaxID=1042133 RepID=A0A9P8DEV1_9HYPO|nr:hypothetical protein J7337_009131 [Fusarium musae]KAG9500649.1 hypothetical protein J7337_009131 [Fusarium musae]